MSNFETPQQQAERESLRRRRSLAGNESSSESEATRTRIRKAERRQRRGEKLSLEQTLRLTSERMRRKYPASIIPSTIETGYLSHKSKPLRTLAMRLAKQMINDGYNQLESGDNPIPTPRQISKPTYTAEMLRSFLQRAIKVISEDNRQTTKTKYATLIGEANVLALSKRGNPSNEMLEARRKLAYGSELESSEMSGSVSGASIYDMTQGERIAEGIPPTRLAESILDNNPGEAPLFNQVSDRLSREQSFGRNPGNQPGNFPLNDPYYSMKDIAPLMSASMTSVVDNMAGLSSQSQHTPLRVSGVSTESVSPIDPVNVMRGFDAPVFTEQVLLNLGINPSVASALPVELNGISSYAASEDEPYTREVILNDLVYTINKDYPDLMNKIDPNEFAMLTDLIFGVRENDEFTKDRLNRLNTIPARAFDSLLPVDPLLDEVSKNLQLVPSDTYESKSPADASGLGEEKADIDSYNSQSNVGPNEENTNSSGSSILSKSKSPADAYDQSSDPLFSLKNDARLWYNTLGLATPDYLQTIGVSREQMDQASAAWDRVIPYLTEGVRSTSSNEVGLSMEQLIQNRTGVDISALRELKERMSSLGISKISDTDFSDYSEDSSLLTDPRQSITKFGKEVAQKGIENTLRGGSVTDLAGIVSDAARSALRGGFSDGPGGTGNLPNRQARSVINSLDLDRNRRYSQKERDEMIYKNRLNGMGYIEQYNPLAAGRMKGSIKIPRKMPPSISTKRQSNQVKLVQQSVGNYKQRRDIFQTSFS